MKWPLQMKIKPATICCLSAVGGVLLWLNLQMPGWVAMYNTDRPPGNLDPVTTFLFFRGWPFTPCAYCVGGLSRWDPDGYVQMAAFADVLAFIFSLAITGM